jgi:RNA polymerase sigma factor (TIGR02999 family)
MSSTDEIPDSEESLVETFQARPEPPEQLFELVYDELRRIARAYMRRERPDHTMQATALVNEAYLRLFEGQPIQWENRKHLFCTVARSMRRVLMDHGRKHGAERHGGAFQKVQLDGQEPAMWHDLAGFMALSEALDQLAKLNPRHARVVELHGMVGLTQEETAEVLDVSLKTVKNDWSFAKRFLKEEYGLGA